jgi:uncharacterized protein YfaP (DUF2135 family)
MRSLLLLLMGLVCATAARAEPAAEMSEPVGGWRYNGLLDRSEQPQVAYPTPPIDRGVQRNRTMIEGQLKAIGTQRGPHTLAVNGNPLNLYTDDQGRFARPYAFGAGSNSVEVRSAEGKSLKRVQFYEANNLRTPARIRVVLGWDDPKAELDLHIITPDGQHAFFAHTALTNGGGLDPDGVDGRPGRLRRARAWGGAPGFACSPGFGGAAPAGAPPESSASAGTAIRSCSVNDSG